MLIEKTKKPFNLSFSYSFSRILHELNSTLVISTYQAEKVIFLSAQSSNQLIQLPRTFTSPMGLAYDRNKLAIATKTNIITLSSIEKQVLLKKQNKYDAYFIPTASFYTGYSHLHDIAFGKDKLFAVNTNFSIVGTVNIDFNFTPYWKPNFIKNINGGDQCHLNGLAMENGEPGYVTAFSTTDEPKGWKNTDFKQGVLINVKTNKIVQKNLNIPHSPRFYKNKIYFLESAKSKLNEYNPMTGETTTVIELNGFARGMDIIEDIAFIGISKIRPSSSIFNNLKYENNDYYAGVVAVNLQTKKIVGKIEYLNDVNEIYDIKILPNIKKANIIGLNDEQFDAISMPNSGFWID
ncbi:TIGR03032 family protein [Halarcobacter sp.]|uniref:TIGR03032 family protein n=1 Tax=Halarcobacter sp. TaxID=2321133 RepID=UPI0029F496D0|nr:TIGR03032 family protein [Halarcobacter sp.]